MRISGNPQYTAALKLYYGHLPSATVYIKFRSPKVRMDNFRHPTASYCPLSPDLFRGMEREITETPNHVLAACHPKSTLREIEKARERGTGDEGGERKPSSPAERPAKCEWAA